MMPTSISQAINFLTRPLIFNQEPDMIHSLQMILRSTLQAAYSAARTSRLALSLSRSSLPPRPIYAACIATGLQWQEWIALLGSRDFDLVIEPHSVSVTYVGPNPRIVIVWSEPLSPVKRLPLSRLNFQNFQVPISKLGQQSFMQASTIGSAQTRANPRTLAQQLLEDDHKQEADELFAMISKTAIISPTPTREKFFLDIPMNAFPSPLSSPEVISPATSRPSSRSSTSSSSSFFDTESMTSASSTSSDFLCSTKPRNTTTFVPTPTRVFVDNDKKDVTKYLYQGGVSTVLTGGVMLGGSATAKNLGAKSTDKISSSVNPWRRIARV
jgi:hypothetical protein